MDHAGAGGESVDDSKMNTRDFDLYYKDEAGEWKLAKEVRGNKAHVSDITLDHPIKAQDWRLHDSSTAEVTRNVQLAEAIPEFNTGRCMKVWIRKRSTSR